MPFEAKASGKAAVRLMWLYGSTRVSAAPTKTYPTVTIAIDRPVASGILRIGLTASSPDVAIESNPTKA